MNSKSETVPAIYDYRDHTILYLEKLFQKRNEYYNKIKTFDFAATPDESETIDAKINEQIEVPIEVLKFKFGAIGFKYRCQAIKNKEIEFEIENINIRPEFVVLKPYFIKFLKKDDAAVQVLGAFQNNRLIFKSGSSKDLDKLNRKVIDSVRFRFIDKAIIKGVSIDKINLLNAQEIQGEAVTPLYANEKEVIGKYPCIEEL